MVTLSSTSHQSRMQSSKKSFLCFSSLSLSMILSHGLVGFVCAYLGILIGMATTNTTPYINNNNNHNNNNDCLPIQVQPFTTIKDLKCPVCPSLPSQLRRGQTEAEGQAGLPPIHTNQTSTFASDGISKFFVHSTTVPRQELNQILEVGVPFDDDKPGASEALILYASSKAMPLTSEPAVTTTTTAAAAEHATSQCRTVRTILIEPNQPFDCLALIPQWESYYVHKFMRLPNVGDGGGGGGGGGLNPKVPLRYVSRSHTAKGEFSRVPDMKRHTTPAYEALVEYLTHLDATVSELQPLLQKVVDSRQQQEQQVHSGNHKPSIIVQVVNYGQVELFHNYLCNAKAKGLLQQEQQQQHIFLFCTDLKTYELTQQMNIPAYYNAQIFGDMPEQAAHGYGDKIFSKMMMAKVYCVHLVLMAGYNVLFQDVDMVWYDNPLPYLESSEFAEWDLLFQDDGARSNRYAPYSPNTGFYYVKHSPETLFLFGMLLRHGDVIARTSSHQAALTSLLNEHASWKGLRIKVWKKGDTNPFPGGVEYHQKKMYMKQLLIHNRQELNRRLGKDDNEMIGGFEQGQEQEYNDLPPLAVKPYLFHMSWTKNKDNKKLFFQQMGEWYLKEDCPSDEGGWNCCLPEPFIKCHYRDKPSIIPCKNSPPIDAGKGSFW